MRADDVEPVPGGVPAADGERDEGGVIVGEAVLAAGLERSPLLPLREPHEPHGRQPPLRLGHGVESGGRRIEEADEVGDHRWSTATSGPSARAMRRNDNDGRKNTVGYCSALLNRIMHPYF